MKRYLIAYPVTLIAMVLIDAVWLSIMADRLYRPVMGNMLALELFPGDSVLSDLSRWTGVSGSSARVQARSAFYRGPLWCRPGLYCLCNL